MFSEWYYVFPFLLNLFIIVIMNRFYFRSYKLFPYKIEVNNEKMICSDYMKKSVTHEIYMNDIDLVDGGSLSGTPAKPIYIHTETDDLLIGISPHIKEQNKLITIILSNIKQSVYNDVLETAKEMNEANKALFNNAKKSKKKPIKK